MRAAILTDAAAVEVGVIVPVVPHKAVAEVSKIGNL
jgi:Flp pilus assembly pilin Flp